MGQQYIGQYVTTTVQEQKNLCPIEVYTLLIELEFMIDKNLCIIHVYVVD